MDGPDDLQFLTPPVPAPGGGVAPGPRAETGAVPGGPRAGGRPQADPEQRRRQGYAAAHAAERNRLLAALPFEEYARLLPQLTPVRLRFKEVLLEPEVPIRDVYFPREGVAAVLATEQTEGAVEVGSVGREGLIGLPVLHETDRLPYGVVVQIAGDAWRLPADAFARLVDERPAVRRLLLRYSQYFTNEVAQSAACGRLHTLEERCARAVLATRDRVGDDRFDLTYDVLAMALAVGRAGVTVALGALQGEGLVWHTRGRVTILDRPRLEEASCSCYQVTRTALARLLG